jgi:hypothetical protein
MIVTITVGHEYNVTHFQIGIGIDAMDYTANETCSESENDFIEKIMERYTVALARIYFRLDCIDLEDKMQPVDASQFHPLAFVDYNLYMATKYVLPATISEQEQNHPIPLLDSPTLQVDPISTLPILATTNEILVPASASIEIVEFPSVTPSTSPSTSPSMSPSLSASLFPSMKPVLIINDTSIATSRNSSNESPTNTVTTEPTSLQFTNRLTPTSQPTSMPTPLPTRLPTTLPTSLPTSLPRSLAPTPSSTSMPTCSFHRVCTFLDFERFPNGSIIPRGTYVATEWYNAYGLNISVIPYGINWYAPFRAGTNLRQPRIFNSSNPGIEPDGDPDLGSPNEQCTRPGPGKGLGGAPGTKGANCDTHGNILIIQESNKATPDDAYYGGTFEFSFKDPIYFENLGLMDISKGSGSIRATLHNGTSKTFKFENLGENSYQTINILTSKVKKLEVYLAEAGAITHLKFCNASCDGSLLRRSLSEMSETNINSKKDVSNHIDEHDETSQSPFYRHLQTQAFRWGGTNSMTCRGCSGDSTDARRLSTSALDTFLNSSLFLLPAFESVISVGLTVDLRWEYHRWLEDQKESVGCLGNGMNATVVFEMLASKLL